MLKLESVELLLSLPSDDPRLIEELPNKRILDGGGRELAELSLRVEAESLSPPDPTLGLDGIFLNEALDPPLSDKRPYSPSFLGGGIKDLPGEGLRLLAFELSESPPSDFFLGISVSGRRL